MIDTNKYSILSILARTVRLSRQILQQWRVVLIYAATLTIVGLLFGYWGYMCQNGGGILCYSLGRSSYMSVGVLLWLLIMLYLFLAFMADFYTAAFGKKTFKISDIFGVSKAKAKAMAVLLGYGVAFVVPVLVAAKILAMPANPDWRVEMLNFLLIFALFMLQLFMMRTIAALSMFLEQKKHLNMWQIYEKTIGSGYVSIILFLCLLAFSLLTYMIIAVKMDSIGRWFDSVTWFAVVNFADNALKLVYMALMLVFCRAQHELLQPESLPAEDVDLEAANEDHAAPVIAEKPAEIKIKKSVAKKRTTQKSATKTAGKQPVEKAKKTEVAKAKTAENKKKPAKKTTALKKPISV
ncbi:MAG: hypothetical protein IJ824_06040 [Alphaproteobacteria bacterium]|nr:hypothetical protein [Alphaproteobacteria bacterium]